MEGCVMKRFDGLWRSLSEAAVQFIWHVFFFKNIGCNYSSSWTIALNCLSLKIIMCHSVWDDPNKILAAFFHRVCDVLRDYVVKIL